MPRQKLWKKTARGTSRTHPRSRLFDGKIFRYYRKVSTKAERDKYVKILRNAGMKHVRTSKEKGGYVIWWRGDKKIMGD